MSLPAFVAQPQLFSTAACARQLFGATNRYRIFTEKILPLLVRARAKIAGAYCADNGRRAIEPVWLLGVSLLQYVEGAPDREAVDLLTYHAGWNFALGRQVGDAVFHPTVLVYFRNRLLKHQQSCVVFDEILQGLVEAGLVERRGRQRLDSTHVLGVVRDMSRLECVRESLRLALKELEASAAAFAAPAFWATLWERYVTSKLDYRTGAEGLKQAMDGAGADGLRLLAWVKSLSDRRVAAGAQVALLARVLEENFEWVEGGVPTQRPAQPAGAVHNPHEPGAKWSAKGHGKQKKAWVGYKVQVAESVRVEPLAQGEPTRNFLTAVATQSATASDEAGHEQVEREQAAVGLEKPNEWYVDGAYVSGQKLAAAAAEGRELIGPAQPAPKKDGHFSTEDFSVNVEARQAVCPAGEVNTQCSELKEAASGKVQYRFEWSWRCRECAQRDRCVGRGQNHRTLVVGEHHSHLQARREEQKTEAFRKKCHRRNAVEGTQSELVRAHGLRRARYRGETKVRQQNYFIGAACNAKRWIKRVVWELRQATMGAKIALEAG